MTKVRKPANTNVHVSALEDHLGFWLRYVSNRVSAEFKNKVEEKGVSVSEWVALRQLFHTGESSPAELIQKLGMTKGAISKIVSRLEEKKLVQRVAMASDLRLSSIGLTRAGKKLVPSLAKLADENDEAFFGHLTQSEKDSLMSAMKEIVRIRQISEIPTE